jgi:hypothetical protein
MAATRTPHEAGRPDREAVGDAVGRRSRGIAMNFMPSTRTRTRANAHAMANGPNRARRARPTVRRRST